MEIPVQSKRSGICGEHSGTGAGFSPSTSIVQCQLSLHLPLKVQQGPFAAAGPTSLTSPLEQNAEKISHRLTFWARA